jgi:surface carbohydrate biosynthesis protein (TIGR04326 family)
LADIEEVEALRYLHLCECAAGAAHVAPVLDGTSIHILVMGDYLLANTQRQMRLLERAVSFLPQNAKIVIKPHPNCSVQLEDYPGIKAELRVGSISELLEQCDVAYSSSVTSAAVDAYCAGVPVVSVLDPTILNMSPLRECEGVFFASSPKELADSLIAAANESRSGVERKGFFTLDSRLLRWRKLVMCGNDTMSS